MSAKADASPPNPHDDNMGVDSATMSGYLPSEVHRGGEPRDYFYRLALDTVQVSVQGAWANSESAARLMGLRREAEKSKGYGLGGKPITAPDGTRLVVYPHGGNASYHMLIRGPGGLEIRALPTLDLPTFMIRFGARWCVEHSVERLENWIRNLTSFLEFEPKEVSLSEVHIRCDVPTPFSNIDRSHYRGTSTRGAVLTERFGANGLETLDNQGSKKPFKFTIYDKRAEQKRKEGALWPTLWKKFGIIDDVPIWRVEGKWNREALKTFGLYRFNQLSEIAISGLWHSFTTKSFVIVADPSKRTSRTKPIEAWLRIQECGRLMPVGPIKAKIAVDSTQLIKQASGCISKAIAVVGIGIFEEKVKSVVREAVLNGHSKFKAHRKQHLKRLLLEMYRRFLDDENHSNNIKELVQDLVSDSLNARVNEKPYSLSSLTDEAR